MRHVEVHFARWSQPTSRRCFTTLQQRMAELHVTGVSIAVVHNGRIDWANGYGVAWVDGPAVTPQTLCQAESISKPVTALAVIHLVAMGNEPAQLSPSQERLDWVWRLTCLRVNGSMRSSAPAATNSLPIQGAPRYGPQRVFRNATSCRF